MSRYQKSWQTRNVKSYRMPSKRRGRTSAGASVLKFSKIKVKKRSKKLLKAFLHKLIVLAVWLMILGIIFIFAAFIWYSRGLPDLTELKSGNIVIPESTKIYDRRGEHLLYTVHGEENRTLISSEEIPEYIKWAAIAIEDKNFYSRKWPIDPKRVIKALFVDLTNFDYSQGASTITQQLVKNMILSREKSLSRKIKELILAYKIEKKFPKDEILEMYLNQIPYGSNAYGIEQAASTFFDKPSKDLSLAEVATLSALPKATTYFSPYGTHQEELLQRQKIILKLMLDQGYISEDKYNEARAEEVKFKVQDKGIKAPHFVMYVKEQLAKKFGERELEQGGLKIITTLDWELQQTAEEAIKQGAEKNLEYDAKNAALVAIDPKTGQILAMVGSADFFDEENYGQDNVSLRKRQPGSSFKPIVYSALLEKGYTPDTILYDVLTDFDPRAGEENSYIPQNFDSKERGPVAIKKALAGSLNIPAVKALYLAGPNKVHALAQKFGYTTLTDLESYGLSLALGGAEVTLLEHTNAFAVFASEGIYHPHTATLKIENSKGQILEEFSESPKRALSAQIARVITDMLSNNSARAYVFGENNYLTLPKRPSAVKTGTTNESRDAWTIGYTPWLAAGVWAGNNLNEPMKQGTGGSRAAAPIWQAFMKKAHKDKPVEEFSKPQEIKTSKPVLDGEIQGQIAVKIDKASGKLATDLTPENFVEEKTFYAHHSILHFLDRTNPLGETPTNPDTDPQYANWELGIEEWIQREKQKAQQDGETGATDDLSPDEAGLSADEAEPPTEYDDVHTLANRPSLAIIQPQAEQIVSSKTIYILIEASARRGLSRVEYWVDDKFRISAGGKPYSRQVPLGTLEPGLHKITVKAYDDVDNLTEKEVKIKIEK